jgi:hypothetical protein
VDVGEDMEVHKQTYVAQRLGQQGCVSAWEGDKGKESNKETVWVRRERQGENDASLGKGGLVILP